METIGSLMLVVVACLFVGTVTCCAGRMGVPVRFKRTEVQAAVSSKPAEFCLLCAFLCLEVLTVYLNKRLSMESYASVLPVLQPFMVSIIYVFPAVHFSLDTSAQANTATKLRYNHGSLFLLQIPCSSSCYLSVLT